MKHLSITIIQHSEGNATVRFAGPKGCTYHVDTSCDMAVTLSSYLLAWAQYGLLFREDGNMTIGALRDIDTIASMRKAG